MITTELTRHKASLIITPTTSTTSCGGIDMEICPIWTVIVNNVAASEVHAKIKRTRILTTVSTCCEEDISKIHDDIRHMFVT